MFVPKISQSIPLFHHDFWFVRNCEQWYMKLKKIEKWSCIKMSSLFVKFSVIVASLSIAIYGVFYFFPSTSSMLPPTLSYELFGERCTNEWLLKNVTVLKQLLDENVFGQHVASKLLWVNVLSIYSFMPVRSRWSYGKLSRLDSTQMA